MLLNGAQPAIDLTYIYEIGTIIGIGLLVFCFVIMEKIIRLFPGGSLVKKWRIMQVIVVLFIILYIIDWIVWIEDIHNLLFIIGGFLRLATGILFTLILLLFYKTIKLVLLKSD